MLTHPPQHLDQHFNRPVLKDRRGASDPALELNRALYIADRQLARGRIADARRALTTCQQVANVLESCIPPEPPIQPTDDSTIDSIPVVAAVRRIPGDRIARANQPLTKALIPRLIERLHRRRISPLRVSDVHDEVPSVVTCLDEWVRWQA